MLTATKRNFILVTLFILICAQSVFAMTEDEIKTSLISAYKANAQKQYYESINLAQKVLKEDPKNYHALCILGITYGNQGEAQKAIDAFSKASEYHPEQWSANSFLGDTYMQLKGYYLAKQYYQKVADNKTISPDAKQYFENQIKICEMKLSQDFTGAKPEINVKIPFNSSQWKLKGLSNNEMSWNAEYAYNNEIVENGRWSKLVTVNYIKNPALTLNEYYLNTIHNLENISKSLNKDLKYKIIYQDTKETIYEWNIGDGEEAEISRVIKHGNNIYHLHYAQKSNISNDQRSKWLEILKESKIIE